MHNVKDDSKLTIGTLQRMKEFNGCEEEIRSILKSGVVFQRETLHRMKEFNGCEEETRSFLKSGVVF